MSAQAPPSPPPLSCVQCWAMSCGVTDRVEGGGRQSEISASSPEALGDLRFLPFLSSAALPAVPSHVRFSRRPAPGLPPRLSMFGVYTVALQQSFICVDPYLVQGDPLPLSFFCSAYHHAPAVREMRRGFACRPCARTSTRRRTKTQGITGWNSVRRGPLMAVTATARGRRPAGRRTGGV